jgi:hypothetical protein
VRVELLRSCGHGRWCCRPSAASGNQVL